MIKPEQVPNDVWRALQLGTGMSETAARGLVAIMLDKWPGMKPCVAFTGDQSKEWPDDYVEKHMGTAILLPLTENSDNRPRRTLNEMRGVFAEAYKDNINERE